MFNEVLSKVCKISGRDSSIASWGVMETLVSNLFDLSQPAEPVCQVVFSNCCCCLIDVDVRGKLETKQVDNY